MFRTKIILFWILFVLIHLKVTLCVLNNFLWEFKHLCHLNAITFLYFAFVDTILKLKVVFVVDFACSVHVCYAFDLLLDFDHFMKMSSKQTIWVDAIVKIFTQCPWQSKPFIRTCPSTKLIDKNQTFRGCRFEHTRCLNHLTHKSWDPFNLLIRRTHSTNNRVDDGSLKCRRWNKHTYMREIWAHSDCSNISWLSTHIRSCEDNCFILLNMDIISDTIFYTGMSHLQTT